MHGMVMDIFLCYVYVYMYVYMYVCIESSNIGALYSYQSTCIDEEGKGALREGRTKKWTRKLLLHATQINETKEYRHICMLICLLNDSYIYIYIYTTIASKV